MKKRQLTHDEAIQDLLHVRPKTWEEKWADHEAEDERENPWPPPGRKLVPIHTLGHGARFNCHGRLGSLVEVSECSCLVEWDGSSKETSISPLAEVFAL